MQISTKLAPVSVIRFSVALVFTFSVGAGNIADAVAQDLVKRDVTSAVIPEGLSVVNAEIRLAENVSRVRLFLGHALPVDVSRVGRSLFDRREQLVLAGGVAYFRLGAVEASAASGDRWQAEIRAPEGGSEWHLLAEVYDESGGARVIDTGRRFARATQDVEPPTIGTASVDPSSVDISLTDQTVSAQAQLLDNESGVNFAFFYLRHSTLDHEILGFGSLVSGTSLDGVWESDLVVPRYSANGIWNLEIEAYDTAFNIATLSAGVSVEVTGAEDIVAPTLSGPESISPSSVDLSTGPATVVVTAPIQDDVSGTTYVDVLLEKDAESMYLGFADLISGTAFDGTWELSALVPENTSPGVWTLVLDVSDAAGNYGRIVTPSTLSVAGGDTDGPVLSGAASIDPSQVDVSTAAQSVTVTAPLQDASGVSYVEIMIVQGFDERFLFGTYDLIAGSVEDGTWEITADVEPGTPNGIWSVSVGAGDVLGNWSQLATGLTLEVVGSDTSPPELVSSTVSPLIVDISSGNADVEVSVDLTDDISGVSAVEVYWMQGFSSWYGGNLALTAGNGLSGTWSGTAVVQASTPEGTYDVAVLAIDGVGNNTFLTTGKSIQVGGTDTDPPQVSSPPLANPSTVDVSTAAQSITISAGLTDNGVGVGTVNFTLSATGAGKVESPLVDQIFVSASLVAGTAVDGTWEGTGMIPRNAEPGTWAIRVVANDNAGNQLNISTASTFEVVGGDVEPPALSGDPTIEPASADVSGGPLDVILTVPLSDNQSGVSFVDGVLLLGPDSYSLGPGILDAGTEMEGVWRIDGTIPQSIPVGIWSVVVDVWDVVGNNQRLDTGLTFEITGSDTEPPAIGNAVVEPLQVDVTTTDAPVDVSVSVIDNASGVTYVSVSFQKSSGEFYGGDLALEAGTPLDGTWSNSVLIPQGTESGVYTLVFDVTDVAQNYRRITSSAVLLVGISDTDFPVVSAPATIEPESLDLSTGPGTITVSVQLADATAGVANVDFTLELASAGAKSTAGPSQLTASAVLIAGDVNAGVWSAVMEVPQNAEPGTWALDLRAEDRVGNILNVPSAATVQFSGSDPTGPVYAGGGSITPSTVDVTDAAQAAVARLPMTDSGTGVVSVIVDVLNGAGVSAGSAAATIESGDALSGIWKADLLVDGPPGDYSIHLLASDVAGNSVDIQTDLALAVTIQPPSPAMNPDPVDGQRQVAQNTVLRWTARGGRTFYVFLWRSVDPQPGAPLLQTGTAEAAVTLDLATEYSWFVRSTNSAGSVDGPIWTFKTESLPDLVVSSVSVAADQQVGQPLDIEWTVTNQGDVGTTAGEWVDRVVLSFDEILERRDLVLGFAKNVSYLDAGQSYTSTASFDVPADFVGTVYYFVETDGGGTQTEQDESNNAFSGSVVFNLPSPSDLVVTSVSSPTDAFSGSRILVQWTVENAGAAVTNKDQWVDRVFLSPDSVLSDETARLLATTGRAAVLNPTESYTVQQEVPLPADTFGAYWLVTVTDDAEEVFEGVDETNNAFGRRVQIALTPPPDLDVGTVIAPGSANSGSPVTVSWTVINNGASAASGSWVDRVYLSESGTFDPEQVTVLETVRGPGTLGPGEEYVRDREVPLPHGVFGNLWLFVATDTRNQVFEHTFEDNNVSAPIPLMVMQSPVPDLVASDMLVPEQIQQGTGFDLSWRVSNEDGGVAQGPWWDRIFLSSSPTWTPESQEVVEELAPVRQDFELQPGEERRVSVRPVVGQSISGSAFVYVVLDADEQVFEGDGEANNVFRSGQIIVQAAERPDLSPVITASPGEAGSGDLVDISWTVRNSGGMAQGFGWRDAVYLSMDDAISPDDFLLREVSRSRGLAGGAEYSRNATVAIPNALSGEFLFIVEADFSGAVDDVNRANNTGVSEVITITETAPANLVVTDFNSADAPVSGQAQMVSWTVRNDGTTSTRNTKWVDAIWLSRDGVVDSQDLLVAFTERQGLLATGESYSLDAAVLLPLYWSGDSHLILKVDDKNVEFESEESDNFALLPQTVMRPVPSDLVVENVVADAAAEAGGIVNVSWNIRNVSANPARGRMTEGIYLSSDEAWDSSDRLVGTVETSVDLGPGMLMKMNAALDLNLLDAMEEVGGFSGDTPGVLPGDYYLIVRTDNRNNIPETDEQNNSGVAGEPTSVTIPTFTLGGTVLDTWGAGQTRYYCLDVGAGLDLRLTMESQGYAASQVYVAFGRVPTPFDYDLAQADVSSLVKTIVVPSTSAGSYYVLLRSQNEAAADTDDFAFTAEALSFEVGAAEPQAGGRGGFVTGRILGAGFREGGAALLRDAFGTEINAAEIAFVNTTDATVRWDLSNAAIGLYDVVVRRPDGTEAVLDDGFEVQRPTAPELKINRIVPRALLANRPEQYVILVTNVSNNDIEVASLQIDLPGDATVEVQAAGGFKTRTEIVPDSLSDQVEGLSDDVMSEDLAFRSVPLMARNFPPGATSTIQITFFVSRGTDEFPTRITSRTFTQEAFIEEMLTTLEAGRQAILETPAGVDPEVLDLAQDPREYAREHLEHAVSLGLIDAGMIDEALTMLQSIQRSVQNQKMVQALTGSGTAAPLLGASVALSCNDFFRATGCALAVYGCATAVTGVGAVLCVAGLVACASGWELEEGGIIGCLDPLSAANCIAQEVLCNDIVGSYDPNDILGPEGFGDERWIARDAVLGYTIRFENDPDLATAPAREVRITHPLDTLLDVRTFRLGSFGFGGLRFDIPQGSATYTNRLDVRDSLGLFVDVTAGVDATTGRAFWNFVSVDPATGLSPGNPFDGFLALNDSLGSGEGFVTYTIRTGANAGTGNVVDAEASIVFDINPPINTPAIFNTVDADRPTSRITLADAIDPGRWQVNWSGEDVGSGIRDFRLYVSEDETNFRPLRAGITDQTTVFAGDPDRRYQFYIVASDNTGNAEAPKSEGEVTVDVEELTEVPETFALYQGYPNPFNPTITIPFDLAQGGQVEIRLFDVLGRLVRVYSLGDMRPGRYQQQMNLAAFASGMYIYELRVTGAQHMLFREVRKAVLLK